MKKRFYIIFAVTAMLLVGGLLALAGPKLAVPSREEQKEQDAERHQVAQEKNEAARAAEAYMYNPDGSVKDEYLEAYYAKIYADDPTLKENRYPERITITDPAELLRIRGYFWQLAVLEGRIDETAPRLTMEDIHRVFAEGLSFREFVEAIRAIQAYPDFAGGSGLSLEEYWLSGTRDGIKLVIRPFDWPGATLVTYQEDGTVSELNLYDLGRGPYSWK